MTQRIIKFRAWDDGGSKWYYFTLDGLANGATQTTEFCDTDLSNWCEFTGLKDKNGKEIYEDDIMRIWKWGKFGAENDKPESSVIVKVVFLEHEFAMKHPEQWRTPIYFGAVNLKSVEIIGNIYENPELLR